MKNFKDFVSEALVDQVKSGMSQDDRKFIAANLQKKPGEFSLLKKVR